MSTPKETYDVYFLQSEWLENRASLEGSNSDPFSKAFRRHQMTNAFLYDYKTNEKIGEYSSNLVQISSLVPPFVNVINNDAINIFDKLIIPNVSTGWIYKDADSYAKIINFLPPRVITQNMYGQKVVILEKDLLNGKIKLIIEVYEEDF
jgi:hypothetical protein